MSSIMIAINDTNSNNAFTISDVHLQAKDILPAHKNITSLTIRNCTSNQWGNIGKAIVSIDKLHSLSLQHCNTSSELYVKLSKNRSLLRLRIEQCCVTKDDVRNIAQMEQLEVLKIDEKEAMAHDACRRIFSSLKKLHRLEIQQLALQQFDIEYCAIHDSQLEHLVKNLPRLTTLILYDNPISDQGAEVLAAGLPLLTNLDIGKTKINSIGILAICRILKLTELRISENRNSDQDAMILARYLPRLRSLRADQCQIGWEGVTALSSNLRQLKTLICSQNSEISIGCAAVGRLPALSFLKVDGTGMKDWTAMTLSSQLMRLEELWIGDNGISKQRVDTLIQIARSRRISLYN